MLKKRLPFEQADRLKSFLYDSGAIVELTTSGQQRTFKSNSGDTYDVVLVSAGAAKLQVVKSVKEACGLSLKEAKDLVDVAPITIKKRLSLAKANELKEMIEECGAQLIITHPY